MAFTLDDVITPATKDQHLAKMLAAAEALKLKTKAWQPGGITRTILALLAAVLEGKDQITSTIARAGFLKFASEITPDPSVRGADGTYPSTVGWLDILADSVFDVKRIGATYATGPLKITNASGVSYGPFAPGTYHVANPVTKASYVNAATLTIAPSTDTTASFRADLAGADSTSAASSITQTVTSLVGVSIDPAKQTGVLVGSNAESNEALVARCLNKLAALGPKLGPDGAYVYFALTATLPPEEGGGGLTLDGGPITRARRSTDPASGTVTLTIANATGAPSSADVTAIDTYLQAVCVPDAVTAVVQAASTLTVNTAINVWVPAAKAGVVAPLVEAAVGAYMQRLAIGGITVNTAGDQGVPHGAIIGAIIGAASYISEADATLNGVADDVLLTPTQVAIPSVSVTVHAT